MQIGSVRLEGRGVLAPLAGMLRLSLRMTYRKLGAAMTCVGIIDASKMAQSKDGRLINILGTEEQTCEQEWPVCVQLIGSEADYMAEAARRLESSANIIDLNFSGPLRKVIDTDYGAAGLLNKPRQIAKIVEEVVKSVSVPVTAKIRIGIKGSDIDVVRVAKSIEGAGASGITVHARYANEYYTGPAHWEYIKKVRESVGIPVTGNGGVYSASDAKAMLEKTECDFVMIGTEAIINPLIFQQTNELLETGKVTEVSEMMGLLKFFRQYSIFAKRIEHKGLWKFVRRSCRNFMKMRAYMRQVKAGTRKLE